MYPRPACATIPDSDKAKEQLLAELRELRARNAVLEEYKVRVEKLEADLQKNEDMTRQLLEQKLYGVLVVIDDKIAYINEAGARIMGASDPGEIAGKLTLEDIVHPDFRDIVDGRARILIHGKDTVPMIEEKYIRVDGSIVDVDVWAMRFIYKGEQAGLVAFRDITARKRVEEDLHKSEEKYRRMVETANEGIWIVGRDARTTFVNERMSSMLGYTTDEMRGKTIEDFFCDNDRSLLHPDLKRHLNGATIRQDTRLRKKDGSYLWCFVSAIPVLDDQGHFAGGFSMVTDITERKRAEDAIRLANAYNRSLIEASLDPLVTISPDGKITDVNKATETVTGVSRGELVGTDFSDYFTDPDMARKGYKKVFEEGSVNDYPLELRHRDGHITPVLYNATVYRDESGKVIGVFAAARDITKRKQAEEELRAAKQQADLYVDLMGHDINNMNQVSMGFLELAHNIIEMNGRLCEDNIVLLDKAIDSLKNSSQLIDSVRKLQREKMGLYQPEVIDVGRIIDDVVNQFQDIAGRDIKIIFESPGSYPVRANALLKDVFINLIGNAVKHSRGALTVAVRVNRVIDHGKAYFCVEVEDNGPGIPDALKAGLFDRLNLAATRAKGKGFGLCLIKMLVDDYRGKFWVEDHIKGDYTKGARFMVMLPAVEK